VITCSTCHVIVGGKKVNVCRYAIYYSSSFELRSVCQLSLSFCVYLSVCLSVFVYVPWRQESQVGERRAGRIRWNRLSDFAYFRDGGRTKKVNWMGPRMLFENFVRIEQCSNKCLSNIIETTTLSSWPAFCSLLKHNVGIFLNNYYCRYNKSQFEPKIVSAGAASSAPFQSHHLNWSLSRLNIDKKSEGTSFEKLVPTILSPARPTKFTRELIHSKDWVLKLAENVFIKRISANSTRIT
jgi:hypothetical protein